MEFVMLVLREFDNHLKRNGGIGTAELRPEPIRELPFVNDFSLLATAAIRSLPLHTPLLIRITFISPRRVAEMFSTTRQATALALRGTCTALDGVGELSRRRVV